MLWIEGGWGLVWIGLERDWVGLGWVGLDWVGLGIGLGLDWGGLDCDWVQLGWMALGWGWVPIVPIAMSLDWFALARLLSCSVTRLSSFARLLCE